MDSPQYRAPIAKDAPMPEKLPCMTKEVAGTFEAILQTDGTVQFSGSLYEPLDGNACQKQYVIPVINKWRFAPAVYEEKAIPVVIRIFVEPKW
jgi:hypothetical protein